MIPKHRKAQYFSDKGLFADLGSFAELESRILGLPVTDRGGAFEVFAEAFFKTQALHQAQEVWPDSELPQSIRHKLGLPPADMGIDGVFKTHTGEYHAYQVKYRTNRLGLSWDELSTFMGLSDKSDKRVLFTNSNDLSSVMDARVNFYSIKGNDLDKLDASDFKAIENWLKSGSVIREKKSPRPHQAEAINDILHEFNVNDRTTAVMACATGKTLIALWVAERKEAQTILVLLPSLALVRQTLHDWAKENNWDKFNYLCVCSDGTVIKNDDGVIFNQHDLDFSVTTETQIVQQFLQNQSSPLKIIFSTYQSCKVVAEALPHGFSFDLAIFDEAHKTASRQAANSAFALHDKNLLIKKRLFLTATPRHYNIDKKDKDGDQILVFSMDNQEAYGRVAHQLSFKAAVQKNLICDYKVIISIVTSEMVNRELLKKGEVVVDGDVIKAQRIANILAIKSAVDTYAVKRIFSFHSSVSAAKSFTARTNEGIGAYLKDFTTLHVNGEMSTSRRETLLKEFEESPKAIISNARCLTEGVNVPAVDMVVFVSPKKSKVDIVQAAGRAMRKAPDKEFGYILIPLFVQQAENETIEQALEKTKFTTVWDVLQALQEQDESLVEIIRQLRENRGKALGVNDNRLREKIEVLGPEVCINALRTSITTKIIDKLGLSWDERFGELIKFKEEHDHCDVPRDHKNAGLERWVGTQRQDYRKRKLSQERISKLEMIAFTWNTLNATWEKFFSMLCQFKKLNGHCNVPSDYHENIVFATWTNAQRQLHKKGKLLQNRQDKLDEIGFIWFPFDEAWDEMYKILCQFQKENGHSNVPRIHKYKQLSTWVHGQRNSYKNNQLIANRVQKLNKIGFFWDVLDAAWEEMYEQLRKYKEENGNCDVPKNYAKNIRLARWIVSQRGKYNKDKLTSERIQKLDKIGYAWDPFTRNWDKNFEKLCEYKKINGNCVVPKSYSTDQSLVIWVGEQRKAYKKGLLSQERHKRLEEIGFDWDPVDTIWQKMFNTIQLFKQEHGHCMVPEGYPQNPSLAIWVSTQRYQYRKKWLSEAYIEKLTNIGFEWDPINFFWESMYQSLCEFKTNNGHCDVPKKVSPKLVYWIQRQRSLYRKQQLSPERIFKLKQIDFPWDSKKIKEIIT